MATYIISDLHAGHSALLRLERSKFETIEEHDNYLVESINKVVKNTDILYILGDIGNIEIIRKLNGRKICIMGNHDRRPLKEYLGYFAEVYEHPIYINDSLLFSHYPVKVESHVLNVHGHLHGSYLESTNHINVSAHLVNYTPVNIDVFYQKAGKLPRRDIQFLHEWYADLYVFTTPRNDIITSANGRINLVDSRRMREKRKQQKEEIE